MKLGPHLGKELEMGMLSDAWASTSFAHTHGLHVSRFEMLAKLGTATSTSPAPVGNVAICIAVGLCHCGACLERQCVALRLIETDLLSRQAGVLDFGAFEFQVLADVCGAKDADCTEVDASS